MGLRDDLVLWAKVGFLPCVTFVALDNLNLIVHHSVLTDKWLWEA